MVSYWTFFGSGVGTINILGKKSRLSRTWEKKFQHVEFNRIKDQEAEVGEVCRFTWSSLNRIWTTRVGRSGREPIWKLPPYLYKKRFVSQKVLLILLSGCKLLYTARNLNLGIPRVLVDQNKFKIINLGVDFIFPQAGERFLWTSNYLNH